MAPAAHIAAVSFADLPGWADDDHAAAFAAFRRSAFRFLEKPYRTGALGVASDAFAKAFAAARELEDPDRHVARDFFERYFLPFHVNPVASPQGFVTGFYEPVVEASPIRTARFRYPLLARPHDLVDVDDSNRPAGLDPYFAFGRQTSSGVAPYFDRGEIERGALDGQGLEIAWLADKVDLFFVHVQGAARLKLAGGTERRVTYAAKTGHPFTGPGRILIELGEIAPEAVTMQSIRAWLAAHPGRVDEILWRNRSFIFFRDAAVDDPALGPVAAAKVPLTPGRSMAVDRLLHTFGTPFFIDAPTLRALGGGGFRRLMIAQDTGSAIVGPARGDLFAGSGDAAGDIAGVTKHPARFFMLVPASIAERFT
ncbi:MAG: murein transglycosylase A [Rhizobiaceae bacterium]|nr:murein transglycosylase A [Rhizobiaceae bacterium]